MQRLFENIKRRDMEVDADVYKAARKAESYEEFEKMLAQIKQDELPGEISDANFKEEAKARLMDLSTTNDQILELAEYATKSPELTMFFQTAMALRTQIIEMLSNVIKSMQDAMRTVIANMRP